MIHPRDNRHHNPRLQCDVCGKWKRLHLKDGRQSFYGGCGVNIAKSNNQDHTAAGDSQDVCEDCCRAKCGSVDLKIS
jgi:hypothetical protein